MMNWLSAPSLDHPGRTVLITAVLALVAAAGMLRLELRTDGDALMPRGHPVIEQSEEDGTEERARKIDTWTRWGLPVAAETVLVDFPWGRAVDTDKVAAVLKANPDTKLLAFVHAETSTGASIPADLLWRASAKGALAAALSSNLELWLHEQQHRRARCDGTESFEQQPEHREAPFTRPLDPPIASE